MFHPINIILLLQIPIIASIIIIGFQAANVIKEFKYISIAWSINLVYIVSCLISNKFNLSISSDSWFVTLSDLTSTYFFFLATFNTTRTFQRVKNIPNIRIKAAIIFIIAGLLKIAGSFGQLDFIPFIIEGNLLSVFLDTITLFSLSLFFRKVTLNHPQAKILPYAAFLYSCIQVLDLVQKDSFGPNSIFINYLDMFGFGIAFVLKFCILIGLSFFIIHTYRNYSIIDHELKIKKAVSNKLSQILGRTFHEVTPPILEVETITNLLMNPTADNQKMLSITKKTKEQLEIIDSAVHRAKTILTASIKMYHSEMVAIDDNNDYRTLPIPIDEEEKVQNLNTLLQIAIMNFKSSIANDQDVNNIVTDEIKFNTEYGGNCDIMCNSVQMVQVFYNLFKNSYEACNTVNMKIKCHVSIKTKNIHLPSEDETVKGPKIIQVDVEDNGPGIPEELLDKVFNLGFSTKETKGRGRGFGLEIVKSYTEHNNGVVRIESPVILPRILSDNPGTRFIFHFQKTK